MSNNFILPLGDYQQIYRTVNSIVEFEKHTITSMCFPFNSLGAKILSKYYFPEAKVTCGGAAFKLDSNNDLITGPIENNSVQSDNKFFHCWVMVDDWMIDFRSPLFENMAKLRGLNISIPPKMFQKQISSMSNSPSSLSKPGDFYLEENKPLTKYLIDLNNNKLFDYLVKCCLDWYCLPITNMKKNFHIIDKQGINQKIKLNYTIIKDAW